MSDTKKLPLIELRPANENPWYCLATLHGEQLLGQVDRDLAHKNSEAWNLWTGDVTGAMRDELAAAFNKRAGDSLMPPERAATPDFFYAL